MKESFISNSDYHPIKIKALKIYGEGAGLDIFYCMKSGKVLKINHEGDSYTEVIERYEQRGLSELHLRASDYLAFVNSVRERLSQLMAENRPSSTGPNANESLQIRALSSAHDVFKTIMSQGNFDDEKKAMLKTITKGTIQFIKKLNIYEEYDRFKKECEEDFLQALLTSYLTSAMIEQFSWSNDEVKEKVVMAAMLCDLTLTPEDFFHMKNTLNSKDLPQKVFNHPVEVALKIEDDSKFVPAETITIIRQHHERPNGKGYPKGLGYKHIANLTAIFIVANYFCEQAFNSEYNEENKGPITKKVLNQVKEKFYSGPFRKSSEALLHIFNVTWD